jgi:hypothetical protein
VRTLRNWRHDSDLVGVRGPDALARLPAEERAAWRSLRADVEALREKAQGDRP